PGAQSPYAPGSLWPYYTPGRALDLPGQGLAGLPHHAPRPESPRRASLPGEGGQVVPPSWGGKSTQAGGANAGRKGGQIAPQTRLREPDSQEPAHRFFFFPQAR